MKEKPILPLLLSLAIPMILSMLVNSLYNIVDSIFVAKISEDAMAALFLVYPVQNMIGSIAGALYGISNIPIEYLDLIDKVINYDLRKLAAGFHDNFYI